MDHYIWGKRFLKKLSKSIDYWKARNYCHYTGKYRGAAPNICNSKFTVPNGILEVFHNGSNYDYHFIINELPNEEQFECLGGRQRKIQKLSCSNKKANYKNR